MGQVEDSEKNGVVLCFASDATTGTRVLGGYVDPLPGQSGFNRALVTPKQPYLDAKFTLVYYAPPPQWGGLDLDSRKILRFFIGRLAFVLIDRPPGGSPI